MNPNTLLGSSLIVLAVAGILLAYALAVRDMLRGPAKGLHGRPDAIGRNAQFLELFGVHGRRSGEPSRTRKHVARRIRDSSPAPRFRTLLRAARLAAPTARTKSGWLRRLK